jgi:hypothetical protein
VYEARVIPSVAYTDPEVAWVCLTEDQAKAQGIKVKKGLFLLGGGMVGTPRGARVLAWRPKWPMAAAPTCRRCVGSHLAAKLQS